jgi:uncharacterized protein YbaR (Trm112 family)
MQQGGEMLDPKLLEILVCPKCKGELEYRARDELVCHSCRLRYEIGTISRSC